MAVTVGFKETKDVLNFVIPIVKGSVTVLEDGKIQVPELVVFLPALLNIKDAIEGIEQVPLEFKLSTPEEAEELKQYLREQLDLPDEKMEEFIEDAFALVLDLYNMIKKFASQGTPPEATTEPTDAPTE